MRGKAYQIIDSDAGTYSNELSLFDGLLQLKLLATFTQPDARAAALQSRLEERAPRRPREHSLSSKDKAAVVAQAAPQNQPWLRSSDCERRGDHDRVRLSEIR